MKIRIISLITLGMLLIQSQVWAQQTLQVPPVIGNAGKASLIVLKPIAEGSFTSEQKDVQELYNLLLFDLQFSGAFTVFEENPQALYIKQQEIQSETVDYASWKSLRIKDRPIDYVVKTRLVSHGANQYELQLLVYDIQQGRREIGRAYGAPPNSPFGRNQFRTAGHTATAEVISTLTNGQVEPITRSKICFVNNNLTNRTQELFLVDYDGHESSLRQLTFFDSQTILPDWSPDGEDLAYVSFRKDWADIYIQNVKSGDVTTLAKYKGTNTNPTWFPDGEKLMMSLSSPGNFELCTMPRAGGVKPERITFHEAKDISPDIAPDGSKVVFTSDRNTTIPQIYTMNPDGSDVNRISYIKRQCDQAKWSPVEVTHSFGTTEREGFRIVFTGFYASGASDIWTMWPDGTDAQALTSGNGICESPSWSPDAQYIVFASDMLGSNKFDLFLMSAEPGRELPNGKRFHRITYLPGNNMNPSWSPN